MEEGVGIEPTLGPNLGHTGYKSVGASSYTNLPFLKLPSSGLEPESLTAVDFKSTMFTNFIMRAYNFYFSNYLSTHDNYNIIFGDCQENCLFCHHLYDEPLKV